MKTLKKMAILVVGGALIWIVGVGTGIYVEQFNTGSTQSQLKAKNDELMKNSVIKKD